MKIITHNKILRRKRRVRGKIFGVKDRPRVVVFRSNRHIYAQVIDDEKRKTICAFSSLKIEKNPATKLVKKDQGKSIGLKIAEKLKSLSIKQVVFDRSRYQYHGRVAAVADGLREGGITL